MSSSKIVVIIASGDKETIEAGLMYGHNAKKKDWMEDVKIILFGPSERTVVKDEQISSKIKDIIPKVEIFACKACSDEYGVSTELEKIGVVVEYVGERQSNLIKDGYIPLVW
ncbi:DsrE family protein [[Eubacterium] cellulosolvens]